MRPHSALPVFATLLLAACGGHERAAAKGPSTLVMSLPADADNLLPPLTTNATASEVGALMFEKLVEPGDSLNTVGDAGFRPSLADSWTWSADSLSIAFHLDPKAHWHDGVPVRASDVVYSYRVNSSKNVGSPVGPLIAIVDSVTARDSLTPVFWFHARSPEQFYSAGSQIRVIPAHLLQSIPDTALKTAAFGRNPVGSGPYHFAHWVSGSSIELDADTTFHRGRPKVDRLIWSITPSPDAAILRLFSGEANFTEYLRPQDVAQLARHPELKAVHHPSLEVFYMLFNMRAQNGRSPHPIFSDRDVRQALTMAVDRRRAVTTVFDSLTPVATGPFSSSFWTYDSTLPRIPYAVDSARALLDRRGWVMGADSVRHKNGMALHFTILVPSTSVQRQQMAVLLQDMFKKVGAKADIERVDFAAFNDRQQQHQFESALVGMGLDPTPSGISQEWSIQTARTNGPSNPGKYENARFDAYVDSASHAMDHAKAQTYYHEAYATIIEDAPAIWLYEGSLVSGMSTHVQPAPMRADMWFVHLADWTVGDGPARSANENVALAANAH